MTSRRAQGWTPLILDTNGNGKRDDYVEPNQPVDPDEGQARRRGPLLGRRQPGRRHGLGNLARLSRLCRSRRSRDPIRPDTALAEIYEPPFPGYGPRGGDIDRNGVFWASLASGHLASFDRKKCKVLNGPTATGKHCPEGWTLYPFPGPQFKDVAESGSAEASYFTWVDQFDTFGLGKNVPIATGNMNDALLALVDGKFVVLRVPYPIGYFYEMDGRAHRRPERWLEGQGIVDDLLHEDDVPSRDRQGDIAKGRAVPAASRPAGAVRSLRYARNDEKEGHCERYRNDGAIWSFPRLTVGDERQAGLAADLVDDLQYAFTIGAILHAELLHEPAVVD